jgi:hypothetical protein
MLLLILIYASILFYTQPIYNDRIYKRSKDDVNKADHKKKQYMTKQHLALVQLLKPKL